MNLLLLAGTTEGRLLTRELAGRPGLELTVCVATPYGREQLEPLPTGVTVLTGRLDRGQMADLLCRRAIQLVVDATHPYAQAVTHNIRRAAGDAGLPYLRLLREESQVRDCRWVDSIPQAVEVLRRTRGRVLLTTGSKDLGAYTTLPDYAQRLYPRVLPSVEAIQTCGDLGFLSSHIIAMQGPFSVELNRAMLRQLEIAYLVTKDGGPAGGFGQKVEAALEAGVQVLVVGRPPKEEGYPLAELLEKIFEAEEELG